MQATEERRRYSSISFANRLENEEGFQQHAAIPLLRERPCTHCTEGWVGLGTRVDLTVNLRNGWKCRVVRVLPRTKSANTACTKRS